MVSISEFREYEIRYKTTGVDEATGRLRTLAGAEDAVAAGQEKVERSTASLERAMARLVTSIDVAAKKDVELTRHVGTLNDALAKGVITTDYHSRALALVNERFGTVGKGARLAGHEISQMGAQFSDIAVQLAGGQSPFLVMMQQGSQLSGQLGDRGLKGAVAALGSGLMSFVTNPLNLAVVGFGLAASGAGLLFQKLGSGESDVEKLSAALTEHERLVREIGAGYDAAGQKLEAYLSITPSVQQAGALSNLSTIREGLQASGRSALSNLFTPAMADSPGSMPEIAHQYRLVSGAVEDFQRSVQAGRPDFLALQEAVADAYRRNPGDSVYRRLRDDIMAFTAEGAKLQSSLPSAEKIARDPTVLLRDQRDATVAGFVNTYRDEQARGREREAQKTTAAAEALRTYVDTLRLEYQQAQMSDVERQISIALHQGKASAASAEGQEIRRLTIALFEHRAAQEAEKKAQEEAKRARDEATRALERQQKAIQNVAFQMGRDRAGVFGSPIDVSVMNAQHQAGVDPASAYGRRIDDTMRLTDSLRQMKDMSKDAWDTFYDGLERGDGFSASAKGAGRNLLANMGKRASDGLFNQAWSGFGSLTGLDKIPGFGGLLGGRPDGSAANPFHVVMGGGGVGTLMGSAGSSLLNQQFGASSPTSSVVAAGNAALRLARSGGANVDGFNPVFAGRLDQFLADAPGGGISIYSGYRSPERQAALWSAALAKYGSPEAARKWVAPPGRSMHNFGEAADLRYASPEARSWAHDNAGSYGLRFPMGNEPWHVEPIGGRRMGGTLTPGADAFARLQQQQNEALQKSTAQVGQFTSGLDTSTQGLGTFGQGLGQLGSAIGGAGGGQGGAGLLGGLFSLFGGFFDEGGSLGAGKWGVAGERGPEIIKGPASIVGRRDTAAMMGGGVSYRGGDVIVQGNVTKDTMPALEAAMKRNNRAMAEQQRRDRDEAWRFE